MAGVCSAHPGDVPVDGCPACHATVAEVLRISEEAWAAEVARAEAKGRHTCGRCGFTRYKTVDYCPLCGYQDDSTDGKT